MVKQKLKEHNIDTQKLKNIMQDRQNNKEEQTF